MWLALLWFAAPVFTPRGRHPAGLASRLRDALILGIAIPGLLALLDVFYWWSTIAAALAIAAVRIARRPPRMSSLASVRSLDPFSWRALPILGVLACAWPLLVRPLLDGDSLGYHLPNAAAWVHAHGLWASDTHYWWYPGGSELFAAGVFAVAGPFGLPACGTLALLLLGQRFYAFALRASLSPIAASATSTLLVTAHAVALQSGDLGNDVWLAALLVETLWCLRYEREAFARTASIAALVKPYGFLFAGALSLIARVPLRLAAMGSLGFIAWLARDLIIVRNASIPLAASTYAHPESTTILAHGTDGLMTLMHATFGDGIAFVLLAVALLVTLVASTDRAARIAAACFTVLFLVEPFGFNNADPQLAGGASLRYLIPALAFGAIGVLPLLKRAKVWFAVALFSVAAFEVWRFEHVFVADASTSGTIAIVVLVALVLLLPNARVRRVASGLFALGLLAYGGRLAGVHPAGYYDDELARAGNASAPFAWLRDVRPARVVAWSFPSGAIDVVSPQTHVFERFGNLACVYAREKRALLMTVDSETAPPNARSAARACGRVVYESPAAIVVEPYRR